MARAVRRGLREVALRFVARGFVFRPQRPGEGAGGFGDVRGHLFEVLTRGEVDVAEGVGREKLCEVAGVYTLDERAVVGDADEAAPADDGELLPRLLPFAQRDRHGEAVEARVAAVVRRRAGLVGARVRLAAVGLAEVRVFARRHEGRADRVVIGV